MKNLPQPTCLILFVCLFVFCGIARVRDVAGPNLLFPSNDLGEQSQDNLSLIYVGSATSSKCYLNLLVGDKLSSS